jgi:anhydro-N-acetylmuramic acid kinase
VRVVGMISGTSYDAIETAVADLELDGDRVVGALLGHWSAPFPYALRALMEECLPPNRTTAEQICRLDTLLGQAFADAAADSIGELGRGGVDLVVSHGQTVYHWVEDGAARGTLQLGQPAWIAERTGCPVISDLRARDISAGGQGAPLVSILDQMLLTPGDRPRAALNLGGIANVTVVAPGGSVVAYDTGPANALLDAAVRRFTGGEEHFDRDGERARRGRVSPELLDDLRAEPYYRVAPPKSTGKELFNDAYLDRFLSRHPRVGTDDVVATLTRLTAQTVAEECRRHDVESLMVAGGGVRNPAIMADLRTLLPGVVVSTSADLGIPTDAKEALAFALLGFLTVHGLPGTIPSCTGASAPSLLGSLTPGSSPLRLPAPVSTRPHRLVLVPASR